MRFGGCVIRFALQVADPVPENRGLCRFLHGEVLLRDEGNRLVARKRRAYGELAVCRNLVYALVFGANEYHVAVAVYGAVGSLHVETDGHLRLYEERFPCGLFGGKR